MGSGILDKKVFNFIVLLIESNETISIRKIAKGLGKENSLRSIQLSIERLKNIGKIYVNQKGKIDINKEYFFSDIQTRMIPLIGNIACGGPILADEYIEDNIAISEDFLKKGYDYFLLRTIGDSMNKKGIDSGDVVLIRKQSTANNGDIIVALINGDATLKEFKREVGFIKLIPHSTNLENKIIIVTEDLIIQGIYERNLGQI